MRLKKILRYNLVFWLFAFLGTAALHETLPYWSEVLISAEAQQTQTEQLGPAPPNAAPETPNELGVAMGPGDKAATPDSAFTPAGSDAIAATSWFSDAAARAVLYSIIIMSIAVLLVAGGILTVNLAMLSRRPEDHVGRRSPSDLGFLKNQIYPEVPYEQASLPAVEDDTYRRERAKIQNDEIAEQVVYVGSDEEQSVNSQGVPLSEIRRRRRGENFLERDDLQSRKRFSNSKRRKAS